MKPVVIPRADHPISRKLLDEYALKVMYRLVNHGFKAYLVGGGVRDLMLGRTPKDFDVGTDAHPNQVKKLFRNSRLVGRRFRLAHVHFGEHIIEVSTFRRRAEFDPSSKDDRLIRSDNTFGTPEEDAYRRDFTINGLFYDLETFSVLDYVGGIADLDQRLLRCIGDPDIRLAEDPVRSIRAVKFAARLDFEIDGKLWKAMKRRAPDIQKCAKARVLEEIFRLLREGASAASFQLLQECGLLKELLPEVNTYLKKRLKAERDGDRVFWQYLEALDDLRGEDMPITNSLLLGAVAVNLLDLAAGGANLESENAKDLYREVDGFTREWAARLGIARRDRERLSQMLRAQPRFLKPRGRRFRPKTFVGKHYYPDAEALFALGVRATGLETDTLQRWKELHQTVAAEDKKPRSKTPRRRGGRSKAQRKRVRRKAPRRGA